MIFFCQTENENHEMRSVTAKNWCVGGYFRKANPALERWRRRKNGEGELTWRPVHWSRQDQFGSWEQGDDQIEKEMRKNFSMISFIWSSLFIGGIRTFSLNLTFLCGREETLCTGKVSDTVRPARRRVHEETSYKTGQCDSLHFWFFPNPVSFGGWVS